jgi:predicted phosphodiesterase
MRVALIADVHGNLPALEAVVADIRRRGADRIVCLGDNVSGPLLPKETAEYLMASGWLVLAGNHERQALAYADMGGGPSDAYAVSQLSRREMDWLRSLQPAASLPQGVFLCHGTPRSDREHFLESVRGGVLVVASASEVEERLGSVHAALVACGHSHVPRSIRLPSGHLLVNPGSVGLQAYTDDDPEPYTVQLGCPDARYAVAEEHPDGWRATFHAVPYGNQAMAALAERRGRPDWTSALLRGYVA